MLTPPKLRPRCTSATVTRVVPFYLVTALSTASRISNAFVRLVSQHTGRGPSKVRTDITSHVIVVTLRESLSPHERVLADTGHADAVMALRRVYQGRMHDEMIQIIEVETGRRVEALLFDHLPDPDLAIEVFILHHPG